MEKLTNSQKEFAIACAQWQHDYICGKFNEDAWNTIEEHLTEYYNKYSGPYGKAPKFEVHEMDELWMSLNRDPHITSPEESKAIQFLFNHKMLWGAEEADKYFENIFEGRDSIPNELKPDENEEKTTNDK